MSLTALLFAHGLENGISAPQGLQRMSGGDSGAGGTSRRHYVRPAETARRAWRSGLAKTLLAVRAQSLRGTLLTVSLEQLCRTDARCSWQIELALELAIVSSW
jgi:hypothetical protein